jgi:MFS family permease
VAKRFDWWLLGICLSRVFSGLVFMTYSAALPVLQREWDMSATAGGSVASGFQLAYAFSLVLCSSLADRLGPRPIYLTSMSLTACLSLAFAWLARDYISGFILYTLVGFSQGGVYTTGLMILTHQYPVQRRGMAMGLFIASTSLGYSLSLIISGAALPWGGYKLSFLLTCLGPLLGAVLSWMTLRHTRIPVNQRQKTQHFRKEVLGNRPAMLLIGGYTFHNWELQGMWAWTPAFLASCLVLSGIGGLDAAGYGSYASALFHAIGLLASFSMGMISDRLGRARVIFLMSALSAVCSFVFGWMITWPLLLVMAVGLVYAFSALGDSPVLSAALSEVVEPSYLGTAYGLRSLLGFGAASLAPLVFGMILDWSGPGAGVGSALGWGWAFGALGLGGAAAAWTALRYARARRIFNAQKQAH